MILAVIFAALGLLARALCIEDVEQIVDPDEVSKHATPPPTNLYDSWKDWDSWEASPDVIQAFPYYRSGYDEDGLVVYVTEFGKWNYREWAQKPKEKQEEFWKYFEQYVKRHERDAAMNNDQGVVIILDWEGFELGKYASATALEFGLKMFTSTVRINSSLKYGFMVNTNFAAETFINLSRPFLGNLMEKYEIYGTRAEKWIPKIRAKIPADQLCPKYGGDSSWKPLPLKSQ